MTKLEKAFVRRMLRCVASNCGMVWDDGLLNLVDADVRAGLCHLALADAATKPELRQLCEDVREILHDQG